MICLEISNSYPHLLLPTQHSHKIGFFMLPTTLSLLKVIYTTIADFALKPRADTKTGSPGFFPVGLKTSQ